MHTHMFCGLYDSDPTVMRAESGVLVTSHTNSTSAKWWFTAPSMVSGTNHQDPQEWLQKKRSYISDSRLRWSCWIATMMKPLQPRELCRLKCTRLLLRLGHPTKETWKVFCAQSSLCVDLPLSSLDSGDDTWLTGWVVCMQNPRLSNEFLGLVQGDVSRNVETFGALLGKEVRVRGVCGGYTNKRYSTVVERGWNCFAGGRQHDYHNAPAAPPDRHA